MRRMFGKMGVFCNGLMLGMITDDTLYVRVDDHNRTVFKEAESVPPLNYEKLAACRTRGFQLTGGTAHGVASR